MERSNRLELANSQVLLASGGIHKPLYDDVDVEPCSICYTNDIQSGTGSITDKMTVEFDCKHRFCIECSREMLKQQIKNNALDKIVCFTHKCGRKISANKLEQIFKDTEPEVLEKFEVFRTKRILEGNPLARFCPEPDCDGYMIAANLDARKLSCPKCARSICFRCREDWHGYCTSCEQAMERAFEGFGSGADTIIFCPMCRTKI